ncbi:virB8 family protein [uncultured Shewanella sp.]|uniref:virB8 family protein n=1 Tax=uncultured Shewanella sp. TaxID=173975 RepID=UPI002639BA93|nr:type IV secretion system protein [uncultured Shewanella sp.]
MGNVINPAFDENKINIQKKTNKADKTAADRYLKEIKEFENDRVAIAKSSAKKAWRVAGAFGVIAILAVGAVMGLTPLKRVENHLTIIDPQTGIAQTLKPMSDAQTVTYGEVLDKYWITRFVIERNGYDWETIQHNYNIVETMSNDKVFNVYSRAIKAKDSPLEIFGEMRSILIKDVSVSFLPSSSQDSILAQVHFTRKVIANDGEIATSFKPTKWIATITFNYQATIETEEDRMLNPLGFMVTSYREDKVNIQ